MEVILKVRGYRCERCEHEWIPRKKEVRPRTCTKCKSPYWDVKRKNEKKKQKG